MANIDIRTITGEDRDQATRLVGEYLPDSQETFAWCADNASELTLVAVAPGERLVGVCFGILGDEGHVGLNGIAVEHQASGRGLGSEVLTRFERAAATLGGRRISVGSVGGYVDHFYAKNGYTPFEYFVRTASPVRLPGPGLELVRTRAEGESFLSNLRSRNGYSEQEKERVGRLLDADETIFIFEKTLAG